MRTVLGGHVQRRGALFAAPVTRWWRRVGVGVRFAMMGVLDYFVYVKLFERIFTGTWPFAGP